jgi:hypothetical protein
MKPSSPPKAGENHGVSQIEIAAAALEDFSDDETDSKVITTGLIIYFKFIFFLILNLFWRV